MTTPITLQNGPDAYQTRDGREVRLFTVECRQTDASVVGEYDLNGRWLSCAWTADGKVSMANQVTSHTGAFDLIPKPVRHKREYWLNFYPDLSANAFKTCAEANQEWAARRRIACIKVELDFQEGEGLT